MSYKTLPLKAGIPFTLDIAGKLFLMDTPGIAGGIDVRLVRNGTAGENMPNRKAAFRHVGEFDGVILQAAVDTQVGFFISFDDVQLGVSDNAAVTIPQGVAITNPPGAPIPVTFSQQIVPLGSVAVSNTDATAVPVVQKAGTSFAAVLGNTDAQAVPVVQKAGTIFMVEQATEVEARAYLATVVSDAAPVSATAARAMLIAASATRRGLRVKNMGLNAVAIGGVAVTFANAVVVIQPGETWNENEAPGAAWSAICDTGLSSTLNVQTIA